MAVKLAHIINPVKVPPTSDLYTAQPITFASMQQAKAFASKQVTVELFTTQYAEDHDLIPDFFTRTPDLERSVLDVAPFDQPRKLPLLADVLERLYNATDAEYLVYTNVDIALMPFFYDAVADLIAQGHDAFAINRRRVSVTYTKVEQLPLLLADIGRPHPGFDCFVFHRSMYPKFKLGNICLGIPFIEATMVYNLVAAAANFRLFGDKHLTVHIGLEVMPARNKQYYWHNRKQFNQLLKEIKPLLIPSNLPYAERPLLQRIFSWGLNPGIFIALNMEIEAQGLWNRFRFRMNELRFRLLQRY
jgi:hypothetical protein